MKITNTKSFDITFCASSCADKECSRNKDRIKNITTRGFSMANFHNNCSDYKEKK